MKRYVTEFIGTFFLVLTIALTAAAGVFAPLAIGSALMTMVYMGGHVSGAHYNPAVSLAAVLRGALAAAELVPYWLAQLAGAAVAVLVGGWLVGDPAVAAPAAGVSFAQALVVEFLFTFALALVVLNTATDPATEGNSYFGLAIGFTVAVGAWAGGPISGGAFNPAVGLGPIVVGAGAGQVATRLLLYSIGPLLGGAAAAGVFALQRKTPAARAAAPSEAAAAAD